jgi:hypothetical protein
MVVVQRGSSNDLFGPGIGQFVWRYGVVRFGSLFFLTNTLVRWLSNNPSQRYDLPVVTTLVIISFAYSLSVGAAFGFAAWFTLRALTALFKRRRQPETEPVTEQKRLVAAGGE